MKKSLVLMILLVLISGFAFADEGKFSADYYNFASFGTEVDALVNDYAAVAATYEAEKYTLDFGVNANISFPGIWNYGMSAEGEYFFKDTDEETFGVYASFSAEHRATSFTDIEIVALDFSKTLNHGDKFWVSPRVVRTGVDSSANFIISVPASYYLDRDNTAWYFFNEASVAMPAGSFSDFSDYFEAQGYIKPISTSVFGSFDYYDYYGISVFDVTGAVSFEKVLPFEARGKFTFNHPTVIYASYGTSGLGSIELSTELMSGKFNEDILGLNLNEISTSLTLSSPYSARLDIEFAFDTAKNNDLSIDFFAGMSGLSDPSFGVTVMYRPKAVETPYDFVFAGVRGWDLN